MRQPISLGIILILAACGGRTREYAGPAPAGAMECAIREAEKLGYRRMEGSSEDQVVRVSQRLDRTPADELAPPDRRPGRDQGEPLAADRPTENQLRLREGRGRLRVQVLSVVESSLRTGVAASTADDHARIIVARCTEQ